MLQAIKSTIKKYIRLIWVVVEIAQFGRWCFTICTLVSHYKSYIFTEVQLNVIDIRTKLIILHLDATDANARRPEFLKCNKIFYYSILYRGSQSIIPLCQMITSSHDIMSISIFLKKYQYFIEKKDMKWPFIFAIVVVYLLSFYAQDCKSYREWNAGVNLCQTIADGMYEKRMSLLILSRTIKDLGMNFTHILSVILAKKQTISEKYLYHYWQQYYHRRQADIQYLVSDYWEKYMKRRSRR